MAIDFFGVRLAGRIRQFVAGSGSGPGRVVELWVQPQDSELTKGFGALAFVSEINVNLKMGDNASISLVLSPPFEDALKFMQSELVRLGNGRLEVELGYTTGTFTGPGATTATMLPFSGFIQPTDVNIGSDISITIHALGVGYQMNVVGGLTGESFPTTMSPADAIKTTLQKYVTADGTSSGLNIDDLYKYVEPAKQDPNTGDLFFRIPVAKSVAVAVPGVSTPSQFPDAKVFSGVVSKGPRNDWWFVKEVIQQYGYELFVEGNSIFVVQKSYHMINGFGDRKPRKQFLLRGVVDPTRNMFPILNFSSPTTGVWRSPGVGRLLAVDVDPDKKNDNGVVAVATVSQTPIARGKISGDPDFAVFSDKKQPAGIADPYIGEAARMMPGDPTDLDTQTKIAGHWTDLNMHDGTMGQFTTLGIPDLTPGDVIQASGFETFDGTGGPADNAIYNGAYGVLEVNHKISAGGWETSFSAAMHVFPEAFLDAAKQALSQASADQSAPPQATSTTPDLSQLAKNISIGSSGSVFSVGGANSGIQVNSTPGGDQ